MSGQKVACIITQGFEDSEFRVPYDALRAASIQVDIISPTAGENLKGYKGKETVSSDFSVDDIHADAYDGLLIPGGMSPEHLRADARFVQFVRNFDKTKRPVAAICHGPQLLITAGLVRGRTLTAFSTIQEDLRQIGAHVRDSAVVEDDNWVTSRTPADLPQFVEAFLQQLAHADEHPRMEHTPIGQPLHP